MKVALIQTRTPASPEAGLAHVLPLVREAAAAGARFIATPEGTNVLQKDRDLLLRLLKSEEDDVVVSGLRAAAKDRKRRWRGCHRDRKDDISTGGLLMAHGIPSVEAGPSNRDARAGDGGLLARCTDGGT